MSLIIKRTEHTRLVDSLRVHHTKAKMALNANSHYTWTAQRHNLKDIITICFQAGDRKVRIVDTNLSIDTLTPWPGFYELPALSLGVVKDEEYYNGWNIADRLSVLLNVPLPGPSGGEYAFNDTQYPYLLTPRDDYTELCITGAIECANGDVGLYLRDFPYSP